MAAIEWSTFHLNTPVDTNNNVGEKGPVIAEQDTLHRLGRNLLLL